MNIEYIKVNGTDIAVVSGDQAEITTSQAALDLAASVRYEAGADRVAMSGCPLVEGAVVATIDALGGMSRDEILDALAKVGETPKF